ncbi:MAG TPA: hypothetical protein GX743_05485 [Actinomycetales bacterium]|nr:hypothetical protein [Actinomycetales bacterium]
MATSERAGRVTLPIETGMDEAVRELIERLGADAVRNSDGTELPAIAREMDVKVYSTYFPARGDQDWALANPDSRPQLGQAHGLDPEHVPPLGV